MICDIVINLISDVVFIFILLLLFWFIWYWPALKKARGIFGTGGGHRKILIYISVHEDTRTTTREVVTLEEYEAADYLRRTISRQLKDSLFGRVADFISGLLGFDPNFPEICISSDNLEDVSAQGGAIGIGGPVRNVVTRQVISEGYPWITYDANDLKFQIAKGQRNGEFIEHSGKLSIIEKIKIDNAYFILAYGFGEMHTRAAVEYLANNWRKLVKTYKKNEFAICFIYDDNGEIRIIEEFRESDD